MALSLSQDQDALEDAQTELDNASKYLENLKKACAQREKDRDMRAKMRSDEITAISEAIGILSDDDARDAAAVAGSQGGAAAMLQVPNRQLLGVAGLKIPKYTPLFEQSHYMQVLEEGEEAASASPAQRRPMLLQVASHIRKGAPTGVAAPTGSQAKKVVGYLIDGMVKVLHDDDVEDEHKKEWCHNETETHTKLQADKTAFQEALAETIEKQDSDLTTLTEEIENLEKEIADLDQDVAKATALRKEEHEDFVANFRALDTAVRLIDRAELKLQEFYNPKMVKAKRDAVKKAALEKAGMGFTQTGEAQPAPHLTGRGARWLAGFVQVRSSEDGSVAPVELPDTPTTYKKSESGGVLGLMNQVRDETKVDMKEAEMEEKHAAEDYHQLMHDSKVTRSDNMKSLNTKKEAKANLAEKQQEDKETNELTLQELQAIKLYLRELDIECTFVLKNWEAMHEARMGEEVGLKSAETIVSKEEPPKFEDVEETFDEETAAKHVDQHFPDKPMPKVQR